MLVCNESALRAKARCQRRVGDRHAFRLCDRLGEMRWGESQCVILLPSGGFSFSAFLPYNPVEHSGGSPGRTRVSDLPCPHLSQS